MNKSQVRAVIAILLLFLNLAIILMTENTVQASGQEQFSEAKIVISIKFDEPNTQNKTVITHLQTLMRGVKNDTPSYATISNGYSANGVLSGYTDYQLITFNASYDDTFDGLAFYHYEGSNLIEFSIFGTPIYYPYDSYFLNLTFTFPSKDTFHTTSNVELLPTMFYQGQSGWGVQKQGEMEVRYNAPTDLISVTQGFILARTYSSALPLIIVLFIGFFLLSTTMLIEHKDLSTKAAVFIAIFVFFATFYFDFTGRMPVYYSMSFGANLLLILMYGSVIFLIFGFVQNFVTRKASHYFNGDEFEREYKMELL